MNAGEECVGCDPILPRTIFMHGWMDVFMMPRWEHRPDGMPREGSGHLCGRVTARGMPATTSHAGPGSMVHRAQVNRRTADVVITRLVVQDDIKEGAVHVDTTIVLQESKLPELIHEETHT